MFKVAGVHTIHSNGFMVWGMLQGRHNFFFGDGIIKLTAIYFFDNRTKLIMQSIISRAISIVEGIEACVPFI